MLKTKNSKSATTAKKTTTTKKSTTAVKKAPAKKVVAKKTTAKTTKAVAKKPVAKKTVAKKTVAKKTVAKKPVAKKATTKKPVAKKVVAKKAVAKKATAKKPAAKKKATAKKKPATKKKASAKKSSSKKKDSPRKGGLPSTVKEDKRLAKGGFEDMFADSFWGEWPEPSEIFEGDMIITPDIDISETKNGYKITAEMPGVDIKDIKLEYRNGSLIISAEKKCEVKEDEGKNYYRRECSYGSIQRSFTLPQDIDPNSITGDYQSGVLRININKK